MAEAYAFDDNVIRCGFVQHSVVVFTPKSGTRQPAEVGSGSAKRRGQIGMGQLTPVQLHRHACSKPLGGMSRRQAGVPIPCLWGGSGLVG